MPWQFMQTKSSVLFTLQTKNTTYQMKVDAYGMLLHTYYGEKTDNSDDLSYGFRRMTADFPAMRMKASCADDRLSSDLAPQEYSCFGTGITGSVPCASEMKTEARR